MNFNKLVISLLWFMINLYVRDKNGFGSIYYDKLKNEVNDFLGDDHYEF